MTPTHCNACGKPYMKKENGLYCYGAGHHHFLSWEYLKGYKPKIYNKQTELF